MLRASAGEFMQIRKAIKFILFFAFIPNIHGEEVSEVQNILKRNSCLLCHGSGSASGDFESLNTDEKWRNSGYITVGNSSGSYFIGRLKNAGGNMPINGPAISSNDFNYLKAYIDNMPKEESEKGRDPGSVSELIDLGSDPHSPAGQITIFRRCYSQFTRSALMPDHPTISKIEKKEVTATQACLSLLGKANLKGENQEVSNDKEAQQIIQTFHDFHSTWFPERNLEKNTGSRLTNSIFDESSAALYFTQNLFSEGIFKSVFSGTTTMKAQRLKDGSRVYYKADKAQIAQGNTIERIQVGELVGVIAKKNYVFNKVKSLTNSDIVNNPQDIFKSFGGGVLGDPGNILMSADLPIKRNSDGGRVVSRSLSKSLFRQFYCRDLPLLRQGDESPYVHPTMSSSLPFRNGHSCMRCHSSIDPLARGYRNLRVNSTEGEAKQEGSNLQIRYVHQFKATMPKEDPYAWPEKDRDFYKRPATGRLYMRSFDGTLVDEEFEGLEDLGRVMSEMDDVYACTASRYYHFLTGVKVRLDDLGNSEAPTLSAKELEYRNYVIQLGRDLKKHQSLKELIKQIINSNGYYRPGLGVK